MTDDEHTAAEGYTVMVVDDEPDIRYVLRITLETAGYEVVEAAHGVDALAQVRLSQPQLVLTDRMMPRMDGGELIERLRADERTKGIPIVMITGTRGNQPGADAVLMKPFNADELVGLADRLTGRER